MDWSNVVDKTFGRLPAVGKWLSGGIAAAVSAGGASFATSPAAPWQVHAGIAALAAAAALGLIPVAPPQGTVSSIAPPIGGAALGAGLAYYLGPDASMTTAAAATGLSALIGHLIPSPFPGKQSD